MKETRFRVMHEDGRGYTVYYSKNGRWFCYNNNYDERRGLMILNPTRRITKTSAEVIINNCKCEYF